MTENWYLVLELEFDPNPVTDESVIEQKIDEKRKFWSTKANDFNHGAEYRKYTQMLPDIKRDMIGADNIRAELVKDACEKTYGPIDKTLKMIKKTELVQDTIDKIAAKQKVSVDAVKKRAAALGIKIVASQGGNFQELYDKYYKTKPQNADKYNGMNALLKGFNCSSLYEFLYNNTSVKNPGNLPCSELVQHAKERKKNEFYKSDSVSGTGAKLCAQCEECFNDEAAKKTYDKYLEYIARKNVLDEFKTFYELSGEITSESYSDFVVKLTEVLKNKKLAEDILAAFAKVEKIPIPGISHDSNKNANLKICRCGCVNDISDGRKVCKACGLALQIKCPKCNTINDANINVCKCGFNFANIDKAAALCDLASDALDEMDFSLAQMRLSDADKYWPGYEKTAQLKSRLKELSSRVGSAVEDMKAACKDKRYYEARRQLESIRRYSQSYSDAMLEEEINNGIATAEKYKRTAQTSKVEKDIVDACEKAYEACKDCPGIRELIAKYPPAEPTDLVISPNPSTKMNVLSWKRSRTEGLIYYTVVRKKASVPVSVKDGTVIGRVSMTSINDNKNVEPGEEYFYSVFAERAGVFSDGLSCKNPVINLFEVSGVRATAGDGLVQLRWDAPKADNAYAVVERTDDRGSTITLDCKNKNDYVDKGLDNDKRYSYRVFLSYAIGIKRLNTKGITVTSTPTRPPKPIERLIIKPSQEKENEFNIEWENPENLQVQFFYSQKKTDFIEGDVVAVEALEDAMSTLVVNRKSQTSGTFRYDGDNTIYVMAVVVKSGSAVIGTVSRVCKGGNVKINHVSLVNGRIMINIDVPKSATGFIVLYRYDKFPEGLSDVKTTRKYIPLKQCQYDCGLVIDSNEPQDYYFSVYAEFKQDGDKDYSTGTDYLFSNVAKETITYSINVAKKLFGGGVINMTFESANRAFVLPDIDVMSAVDRAPMFKKSGELFCQIQGKEANGSLSVSIPFPKGLKKGTYIKPFLRDENLKDRYVLKIRLDSDLKIS